MADTIFCPKCGMANQADFKFCTSCGFALSTIPMGATENSGSVKMPPPYIPPVQNTPVTAATAAKTSKALPQWAAPVIVIVVLAGIGFLIWNNEKSKNKNGTGKETGLTDQQREKEDMGKKDNTDFTIPVTRLQARDFAGSWRPYESNAPEGKGPNFGDPDEDLIIEYTNGQLNMYPREEQYGERSAVITCSEVLGNMITCQGSSRDHEELYNMKLELHPSKNEMTISITPASTGEQLVVKARKLSGTDN